MQTRFLHFMAYTTVFFFFLLEAVRSWYKSEPVKINLAWRVSSRRFFKVFANSAAPSQQRWGMRYEVTAVNGGCESRWAAVDQTLEVLLNT